MLSSGFRMRFCRRGNVAGGDISDSIRQFELLNAFELFFWNITLRNKSAHRTCESPTRVYFEARNNLPMT